MTTSAKKNNKTVINSFVVSLRKDVKHARLWLTRDLKKKASRLQEKKGTEQQVAKNARKAERYLSEVNILKKIHPDQVAKYALCGSFAHTDDEEVNKCLKKLSESKLVQKHIIEFEKSHHIPLDKRIILMRALGAKYNKLKKKKQLALQNGKVSAEEENQNSSDNEELESPSSPLPKVAKKADTPKSKPSAIIEKVPAKKTVPKPKGSAESDETKKTSTKPKKEVNGKQSSPWKVTKNIPKEMEIRQLNLEELSSEDFFITPNAAPPSPKENPTLDTSANGDASAADDDYDPFFVRDGKPPKPKENNDIGSRLLSLSQTKRPENTKPVAARKPNEPAKFSNPTRQQPKPREKRPEIKKTEQPAAPVIDEKDLHPSWQAKRKEKINLSDLGACKRNHIKFDD